MGLFGCFNGLSRQKLDTSSRLVSTGLRALVCGVIYVMQWVSVYKGVYKVCDPWMWRHAHARLVDIQDFVLLRLSVRTFKGGSSVPCRTGLMLKEASDFQQRLKKAEGSFKALDKSAAVGGKHLCT